jgi:hypothetical protein
MAELITYDIGIDLSDPETGLDSNSLVHDPAHEIVFQAFGKDEKKKNIKLSSVKSLIEDNFHQTQRFNDEEMIVSGVAISAEKEIYRNDGEEEYNVKFSKQSIKDIIHDYARKGNFNNLNLEHDPNKKAEGVYLIHSYQIDEANGFTAPERFKEEKDGSWITSYKFENKELYDKVKSGEYRGFSVEGVFILDEFGFSDDEYANII